jgi:outer membrane protein OmpA-like peptidoglycan-associated protein
MTDWHHLLRKVSSGTALSVMLCALVAGCASTGTVVLLPEKDGRQTAVSVKQGDKEVVIDQPYAAAKATPLGPRPYVANAQDVQTQFGAALAAQPARAATFTLYFIEGKDEFTEESREDVDRILAEIAKRPVPDVLVVGHTDAVGSDAFNDALGQQRAEAVRAALQRLGIPPEDIHAISRGKRALAVPTADGVAEPRNRRVVILVR